MSLSDSTDGAAAFREARTPQSVTGADGAIYTATRIPTLGDVLAYLEALETRDSAGNPRIGDMLRAARNLLVVCGIPAEVVNGLSAKVAMDSAALFFGAALD